MVQYFFIGFGAVFKEYKVRFSKDRAWVFRILVRYLFIGSVSAFQRVQGSVFKDRLKVLVFLDHWIKLQIRLRVQGTK
jgi:hypothetical protein